MLNNFDRVLALLNCCRVLLLSKSSLLYIEEWNERWVASASKKSCFEALINHQWFIAWYGYCPMKDQFQMHSMYERTSLQAELLSLSSDREKLCVVEVVVVHFVQFVVCQRLTKKKEPMLLNPFQLAVVTLFLSFAILRRHWIHWTTFESSSCISWWT